MEEHKQFNERRKRGQRRWDLLREMRNCLPDELYKKLAWNDDLLDAEQPLAAPPAVATEPSPEPNEQSSEPNNDAPPMD